MRCVGEIDITRPRWSERPTTLVPLILDNVRNFTPGEAERRVEQGRRAARSRTRAAGAPARLGRRSRGKAKDAKRMIDRVRTFSGYREYPKYGIVTRYFVYKQALLEEAERLVRTGVLRDKEDIFYLTFHELHDVVSTPSGPAADPLAQGRLSLLPSARATPRAHLQTARSSPGPTDATMSPHGALVGLPVSAGTVEGRARVIRDIAQAGIETGDILVTTYTDPSWTPLFLAIKGLVTEVGDLMTHGAVIAREYGLPAVVGVERATQLIREGQRIRVHGGDGYVEILPAGPESDR